MKTRCLLFVLCFVSSSFGRRGQVKTDFLRLDEESSISEFGFYHRKHLYWSAKAWHLFSPNVHHTNYPSELYEISKLLVLSDCRHAVWGGFNPFIIEEIKFERPGVSFELSEEEMISLRNKMFEIIQTTSYRDRDWSFELYRTLEDKVPIIEIRRSNWVNRCQDSKCEWRHISDLQQ